MNVKIGNLIKVTGKNVFCKTIAGNYGIIIEKLTNEEFKVILAELEVKYPKGEIDLNEGVVYFESAE